MAISLTDGQSVTVLYGWIFVSLISLSIAASLAEICAVYPTAGGVYYWSAMLSTKKYAPVVSWITGWLTLVGNWTVTLSINFSGAQLILSAITLWNEEFVASQWQTVLMFWAVMSIAFSVNVFGARYLDLINKICIYWTVSLNLSLYYFPFRSISTSGFVAMSDNSWSIMLWEATERSLLSPG